MSETHVVSALRSKRAEISGHIHDLEKRAKSWRARFAHIDAAIKIFSPETDTDAIPMRRSYRRSRYFPRGEFSRLCFDELRKAAGPVTTGAIVTAIMEARGLSADDPALFTAMNDKALGFLREQVNDVEQGQLEATRPPPPTRARALTPNPPPI
jgi:hypothetical protein